MKFTDLMRLMSEMDRGAAAEEGCGMSFDQWWKEVERIAKEQGVFRLLLGKEVYRVDYEDGMTPAELVEAEATS